MMNTITIDEVMSQMKNVSVEEAQFIVDCYNNREWKRDFWNDLRNILKKRNNKYSDTLNTILHSENENDFEVIVTFVSKYLEKQNISFENGEQLNPSNAYLYNNQTLKNMFDIIKKGNRKINRYQILLLCLLLNISVEDSEKLLNYYTLDQGFNCKNILDSLVFIALYQQPPTQKMKRNRYLFWKRLWEEFVRLWNEFNNDNSSYNIKSLNKNTKDVNNDLINMLEITNKHYESLSSIEKKTYNIYRKYAGSAISKMVIGENTTVKFNADYNSVNYGFLMKNKDFKTDNFLYPKKALSYSKFICGTSVRALNVLCTLLGMDKNALLNKTSILNGQFEYEHITQAIVFGSETSFKLKDKGDLYQEHLPSDQRKKKLFERKDNVSRDDIIFAACYSLEYRVKHNKYFKNREMSISKKLQIINSSLSESGYGSLCVDTLGEDKEAVYIRPFEYMVVRSLEHENPFTCIQLLYNFSNSNGIKYYTDNNKEQGQKKGLEQYIDSLNNSPSLRKKKTGIDEPITLKSAELKNLLRRAKKVCINKLNSERPNIEHITDLPHNYEDKDIYEQCLELLKQDKEKNNETITRK